MGRIGSKIGFGFFIVAMASACAPRPAPTPIYAEPVFDKFGNPDCRPIDTPIGGAYTVDLPICPQVGTPPVNTIAAPLRVDNEPDTVIGTGVDAINDPDVPDEIIDDITPPDDDGSGNQNRNQNENQNENQNRQSSGS